MLDGPLRAFPRWVPNSAPPLDHPATRLVDPIGVWLLGCALAAMLAVAVRRRPGQLPARAGARKVRPASLGKDLP
jgi:hypothetical protein